MESIIVECILAFERETGCLGEWSQDCTHHMPRLVASGLDLETGEEVLHAQVLQP